MACLFEAGGDLGQILARSEPQFPHHATGSRALGVFPLHVIMWLLSQMLPSPQQGDRILFSLTSPVTLRVLSVFPGGHCEPQDDPSHSGKDTPCCSQGGRGNLRAPPHCLHRGHTWTSGSRMVWALVLAWPCPVQLGTPVAGIWGRFVSIKLYCKPPVLSHFPGTHQGTGLNLGQSSSQNFIFP